MKPNIDYTLYLITDRELMSTEKLETAVEQAILGGCTVIQLREKNCSSLEFFEIAMKIKKITDRYQIPLIINDRIDIALAVDADGIHIGQSDIPATIARKLIGDNKILGVSVSTLEEAIKAQSDDADYFGIGAMFATDTKTDAKLTSIDELARIREHIELPIVVIGGINKTTIPEFEGIDIHGLAVVSAIISQPDIKEAAKELKSMFKKGKN
ncbi:thiamine phosphate synthase [Tissierella pigra]|uniref:Thiamine-phosphate synthase n=1 Tax=Tissierella pigra TaxID=2607614 RepID=A0A6N7XJY4_9FIRM|nr:thiamine phosphate synthase [Tissierella pigra]MBU5427024.1 thiamine phosphate synthase [Tissierella pigra]MSU02379.1 thiamine phosphate synthase [Tissierella pigra]